MKKIGRPPLPDGMRSEKGLPGAVRSIRLRQEDWDELKRRGTAALERWLRRPYRQK
jgi:hypothetical protein